MAKLISSKIDYNIMNISWRQWETFRLKGQYYQEDGTVINAYANNMVYISLNFIKSFNKLPNPLLHHIPMTKRLKNVLYNTPQLTLQCYFLYIPNK